MCLELYETDFFPDQILELIKLLIIYSWKVPIETDYTKKHMKNELKYYRILLEIINLDLFHSLLIFQAEVLR